MLGLNLNYVVKKYISLSKWYLPRLNWQTKQGNMRKPKLSHWGRVMHICVSELTIIGSDNGLTPGRRQAIIWPNVWISLIGPSGTNYSEILIAINIFSFKKIHLKCRLRNVGHFVSASICYHAANWPILPGCPNRASVRIYYYCVLQNSLCMFW